jgi:hypothetical protein
MFTCLGLKLVLRLLIIQPLKLKVSSLLVDEAGTDKIQRAIADKLGRTSTLDFQYIAIGLK